jgi:hypothetical protein
MMHKQNHPTNDSISLSPLVGEGQRGGLRAGGLRRGRLARDISIIIAVKVIALVVIKVVWFSDATVPTDASVARTLFEPDLSITHNQRKP